MNCWKPNISQSWSDTRPEWSPSTRSTWRVLPKVPLMETSKLPPVKRNRTKSCRHGGIGVNKSKQLATTFKGAYKNNHLMWVHHSVWLSKKSASSLALGGKARFPRHQSLEFWLTQHPWEPSGSVRSDRLQTVWPNIGALKGTHKWLVWLVSHHLIIQL